MTDGSGLRWGVLSTARIADRIVEAARASDQAEVVAVGSRDRGRAEAWAAERGVPRAHGSYDELLADDGVDAVYIGLPNGLHAEWAMRCLEAGKHVLVEKPFDRRVAPVQAAFDLAEERGLVLSEGFMWRHHPQTQRLVELVAAGTVGPVRVVRAWFSFTLDRPGDVRWDPALDGGALMDVGTYCISAARLLCGEPVDVGGVGSGEGVDAHYAGVLRFDGGEVATFDCGFDEPVRSGLEVVGAEGTLAVPDPWHGREPAILRDGELLETPEGVDPYRRELEDLAAAVRDGRAPLLGRDDAVGQARVLEALLG